MNSSVLQWIPWHFHHDSVQKTWQNHGTFLRKCLCLLPRSLNPSGDKMDFYEMYFSFLSFLFCERTLLSLAHLFFKSTLPGIRCCVVICPSQLTNPSSLICVRCKTSYNSYYPLNSFSFLLSSFSLLFFSAFSCNAEQLVGMACFVMCLFFQFVMCVLCFVFCDFFFLP